MDETLYGVKGNLGDLPVTDVSGEDATAPVEIDIPLAQGRGGVSLCRVTFYNGAGVFTINGEVGDGSDALAGDLISVTTQKDLSGPAGTFTIVLHDRPIRTEGPFKGKHLGDVVAPMDLVVISFGRHDNGKASVPLTAAMVGVVGQAPTESERAGEHGVATHTVTIAGFDFGKLFLNAQLTYFQDVPNADLQAFAARNAVYLDQGAHWPAGTKAYILAYILEKVFYPRTSLNYKFDGETAPTGLNTLKPLFGYRFGNTYGLIYEGRSFLEQEDTVWNLLESHAEQTWCELFIDCVPAGEGNEHKNWLARMTGSKFSNAVGSAEGPDLTGYFTPEQLDDADHNGLESQMAPRTFDNAKVYLMLRMAPFSYATWQRLPVFRIDDRVVIDGTVGGEPTVYNVFYAKPKAYMGLDQFSKILANVPLFNRTSYLRFGYRPLVCYSHVFPLTRKQREDKTYQPDATFTGASRTLTKLLYDWYAPSADFLAGSMTVQGDPRYRIGTRLHRTYLSRGDRRSEVRVPKLATPSEPIATEPETVTAGGGPLVREFYIEGVSHSWQAWGTYTTTLRVTRGLPLPARTTDPSARHPKFAEGDITFSPDDTYPFRH